MEVEPKECSVETVSVFEMDLGEAQELISKSNGEQQEGNPNPNSPADYDHRGNLICPKCKQTYPTNVQSHNPRIPKRHVLLSSMRRNLQTGI
ncbi:hypothetical protein K9M79_02975 [Candidatus Woesearchaeota archaeon]|nr:hypothetical protein [Candidatus Woesearchaeota archaeon]